LFTVFQELNYRIHRFIGHSHGKTRTQLSRHGVVFKMGRERECGSKVKS